MAKTSKIDQFKNNLALAKDERRIPAVGIPVNLAILETRIEKCLQQIDTSFFEIGKALADIQKEKEYPEKSFEQYVKRRWNRSRDWGYKMIEGYEVRAGLPKSVEPVIQNQKQALAIGKAPKEKRAAILKAVVKEGEVTPKKITEKIQESEAVFREITKDANDDEVPEEIAAEFQKSRDETKRIRGLLQEVRRWAENEEPFKVEVARRALIENIKESLSMVAVASGDYVCPYCKGKQCKVCHKRGFVSKMFYAQSIPDDKK